MCEGNHDLYDVSPPAAGLEKLKSMLLVCVTLFTDAGGGGGDVCVYWVLFSVCVSPSQKPTTRPPSLSPKGKSIKNKTVC